MVWKGRFAPVAYSVNGTIVANGKSMAASATRNAFRGEAVWSQGAFELL
jgi:hypothetical protein